MRILVLTSTFARWSGDTEPRFVDDLCQHLSKNHEVHVVAPHAPGAATAEMTGQVQVFRFRYAPHNWQQLAYDGGIMPRLRENRLRLLLVPLFLIGQLVMVRRLLRLNDYDVIHAHWIIPQGLVGVLARFFQPNSPPLVITSHGGDLFALRGGLMSRLTHWIASHTERLTVVSSAMKERATELHLKPGQAIDVIPMGTDAARQFNPPPPGTPRKDLLFVGRMVDKKGIEYLLQALPAVLARQPDVRLTLIGDGPLLPTLQRQSDQLGLMKNVHFLGAVPNRDIPKYLQTAAVTVFPSIVTDHGDQEGTPVAIMEALACECPCVVSDYPGARDIIHENKTGLLAPQKDPATLAKAILWLLEHPAEARDMGRRGRQLVEQCYDWQVVSTRFSDLFRELAELGDGESTEQSPRHENR